MNNLHKTIKAIELDKVLEEVVKYAINEEAKDEIRGSNPINNQSIIEKELIKTLEAYSIIEKGERFNFEKINTPIKDIEIAKVGGILTNKSLKNIEKILEQSRRLSIWGAEKETYELNKYIKNITIEKELENKIKNTIINDDEIFDKASKSLQVIRRSINKKTQDIRESLQRLINSNYKKYLMENIITIRDNRYVIPIKSEYKSEVKGMVHDVSASGGTIFIEPMIVVELNNEIKILKREEQNEIERILRELSSKISEKNENIINNYKTIIILDKYFAKGEYAGKTNSIKPKINNENNINLKRARHPLIQKNIVVPINIAVGKDNNALIITGPNTGGKTVALKTVGLFSFMLSVGLLIPCEEGSDFCIFDNVLLNIGDEQSIEQSLSTFSADIKNIINIINNATEKSLILLDELGSGTDPQEGASLAIAIMDELIKRGSIVISTSHFSQLKEYGLKKEGVINGSFEFDLKTLKPTYKLTIGLPGSSNAFAICKRLGVNDKILKRAKEELTLGKSRFEDIIENIEEKNREINKKKEELKKEKEEIEEIKAQIIKERDKSKEEINNQKERSQIEIESSLEKTKEMANRFINRIKELDKKINKETKKETILSAKKESTQMLEQIENSQIKKTTQSKSNYTGYKKGDIVEVISLNQIGEIIEKADKNKKVLVKIGNIKTRLLESELNPIKGKKSSIKSAVTKKLTSNKKLNSELDVRGQTAEEAIASLEYHINSALINNVEQIFIIHGIGIGVLKKAIRDHLKSHKKIKNYRPGKFSEGEDGVTIATLN